MHGAASNASRWEEFVEVSPLARRWLLIRGDARGHGASAGADLGSLQIWARDAATVLDALEVPKAVVVGHSLGAAVAMTFAKQFPDRTAGAVLIDPLLERCLRASSEKLRTWLPAMKVLRSVGLLLRRCHLELPIGRIDLRLTDALARESLTAGPQAVEAFKKSYSSVLKDLAHEHLADYAQDILQAARPLTGLSEISCPRMIMAASSGVYTDSLALQREAVEAGADFVRLNCLHWPITECFKPLERGIREWIESRVQ